MPTFTDKLKHAWMAFNGRDRPVEPRDLGVSSGGPSDKPRPRWMNERSIINAVYNRFAVDASSVSIYHVRVDKNGNYRERIDDGLNDVLSVEANIDQSSKAFFRDIFYSMLEDGYIAVVPTKTTTNPNLGDSFEIQSMRRAKIVEWYPRHIKVQMYDEATGLTREMVYLKRSAAIVENPFYSIMNAPNSTLRRLTRKLAILDAIDEQNGSGKLDMIIQLPYVIKTPARREEAEKRRTEIERQLKDSTLGIAYTDGTERIVQLNRPVENNLLKQIEYLTDMLFSQLGITNEILNGTADEKTMLNYYSRIIEPILDAAVDEFKRKFLTKTARTKGHSIKYFRDPFKLTPVSNLADIADRLTRNEILSSNEMRAILGYIPSDDPNADRLMNKNLKPSDYDLRYQQPVYEDQEQLPMEEVQPYAQ